MEAMQANRGVEPGAGHQGIGVSLHPPKLQEIIAAVR